jgi:hypothetical protein
MGDSKPDPDMIVALEQCKHGNSAAGIATLERSCAAPTSPATPHA